MVVMLAVYLCGDMGAVSVSGTFIDAQGNVAKDASGNPAPSFTGNVPAPGDVPKLWSQVANLNGLARDLYPGAVAVRVTLTAPIRAWQRMGQDLALFQNNRLLGQFIPPDFTASANAVSAATQADLQSLRNTLEAEIAARYTNAQVDTGFIDPTELATAIMPFLKTLDFQAIIANYYTQTQSQAAFIDPTELASALTPYLTAVQSNAAFIDPTELAAGLAPYLRIADFQNTIANYLTKTQAEAEFIDPTELAAALSPYYTKAQIDALFANVYSRAQTDSLNPPFLLRMSGRAITLSLGGGAVIASDVVPGACKLVQGKLTVAAVSVALALTIRKNGATLGTINLPVLSSSATYTVDFSGLADTLRTCALDDVVDVLAPAIVSSVGAFTFRVTTAKIAGTTTGLVGTAVGPF